MVYPNIEAERARSGKSKKELATEIGVSPEVLNNWQNGRTDIPAAKVVVLAKLFNVTTDYLLGQ